MYSVAVNIWESPLSRNPHFSHSSPLPPTMPMTTTTTTKTLHHISFHFQNIQIHTLMLLYLPVSTHGVIGQFCGLYFTVLPVKLQLVSFPTRPINVRDLVNILLISFSWSVLILVFPGDLWPVCFVVGP